METARVRLRKGNVVFIQCFVGEWLESAGWRSGNMLTYIGDVPNSNGSWGSVVFKTLRY